jgi:hypothetical protein
MGASRREEFLEAVRTAAEGTPYAVTPTDAGFDVGLDLVDAQWYGLFNKQGLTRTFVHHVAVSEDGTYSITDDSRSLEWVAGVPRMSLGASRTVGRVKEFGFEKVWALDEHGRPGKVVDYRFGSEEGRSLVTAVGDRLGLRQKRGRAEAVGLWFGVAALVGMVLGGVIALVLLLLGKL